MQNVDLLMQYREYLIRERDASENTMSSYMRDLRQLQEYLLQEKGITLTEVNEADLQAYSEHLRGEGKSVSTIFGEKGSPFLQLPVILLPGRIIIST